MNKLIMGMLASAVAFSAQASSTEDIKYYPIIGSGNLSTGEITTLDYFVGTRVFDAGEGTSLCEGQKIRHTTERETTVNLATDDSKMEIIAPILTTKVEVSDCDKPSRWKEVGEQRMTYYMSDLSGQEFTVSHIRSGILGWRVLDSNKDRCALFESKVEEFVTLSLKRGYFIVKPSTTNKTTEIACKDIGS